MRRSCESTRRSRRVGGLEGSSCTGLKGIEPCSRLGTGIAIRVRICCLARRQSKPRLDRTLRRCVSKPAVTYNAQVTADLIPFNRPSHATRELEYVTEALQRSGHISGDGAFTKRCQAMLKDIVGVESALLTTSCT